MDPITASGVISIGKELINKVSSSLGTKNQVQPAPFIDELEKSQSSKVTLSDPSSRAQKIANELNFCYLILVNMLVLKIHKPSYSFSLEDKILPRLADLGELRATLLETEFIDIGIPDDYLRFCEWIKRGKEIEL